MIHFFGTLKLVHDTHYLLGVEIVGDVEGMCGDWSAGCPGGVGAVSKCVHKPTYTQTKKKLASEMQRGSWEPILTHSVQELLTGVSLPKGLGGGGVKRHRTHDAKTKK